MIYGTSTIGACG